MTKEQKKNYETLLECHYLNGLCYARYDSDPYLAIRVSKKCIFNLFCYKYNNALLIAPWLLILKIRIHCIDIILFPQVRNTGNKKFADEFM